MRRDAAAQFLGVSSKTLYRLERAGKLPARKEKTARGHAVEYDVADLERLKGELEARAQVPKAPRPPRLKRVTFGLSSQDFEELAGQAERYGLKPGEYARRLMRESLESQLTAEMRALRAQEKKTAGEIKRLRSEVASAVEALLEYLHFSPAEASKWVNDNLR